FGDVVEQEFETPESLANEIDRQIHENYKLYPINLLAAGREDSSIITEAVKLQLADKLEQLPEGARPYLVASYANPVNNQD
ncbi:1-acyl-sn-glycerol-3-phosphate acyltransferase, partial [Vibrio parahaemolyticus]